MNASFTRISLQNETNNPKFTGIYGTNEITSWLVGSRLIMKKDYVSSNLRNTFIAKYGETNNRKSSDKFSMENLYRFRFKRIDSYCASEVKTVFNDFGKPNIYKVSAGASKTFRETELTNLHCRLGLYFQKQFSPKLDGISGIEFITEYKKQMYAFNTFESKAEIYTNFEDLSNVLIKWTNTFISQISDAFSFEIDYLIYYETKPKNYEDFIIYDTISRKSTIALSIVYDFK